MSKSLKDVMMISHHGILALKGPTRSQSHQCWALEEPLRTAASLLGTGEHTVRTVRTERKRSY